MVDSFNTPGMTPETVTEEVVVPAKTGFLSTAAGRIIVGGAAVVVILAVIGFIVFYFFLSQSTDSSSDLVVTPPPAVAATTTPEAAPVEPPIPPLDDTFSFRNVFAPSIKPAVRRAATGGTTTGGTTDGSATASNTLYLLGIGSADGEPQAAFSWNGTEYIAGEGDPLGDTPWSVVSIGDSSVTMLYGDTRVVISLGQGITK